MPRMTAPLAMGAATRPPAVYRGNPFQIEVALAYGGTSPVQKVTLEALTELLSQSDARTLRQFILNTFDGIGSEGAELTSVEIGLTPEIFYNKINDMTPLRNLALSA